MSKSKNEPDEYLTKQIITYMGNKRKVLPHIEKVLIEIKEKLGKDKLTIGDGFSGSGIVSRMLKRHASELYSNDLAGYSHALNNCYLASPTKNTYTQLCKYIDEANRLGDESEKGGAKEPWIEKHWSGERAYFTVQNARRIDAMRDYIETIPPKFKDFVLAPLLVECSIHNNTSGQFSAYHRGGFGGTKGIDVKRITQLIRIPYPIFDKTKTKIHVSRIDSNIWAQQLPKQLDVIYYDPPYNKHPYNIYYFLLDIIHDWDKTLLIPDSYRGQPNTRSKSLFNSSLHAQNQLDSLLSRTNARFIIISYFDRGIIPIKHIQNIISNPISIPIIHNTYKRNTHYNTKTQELIVWGKGTNGSLKIPPSLLNDV